MNVVVFGCEAGNKTERTREMPREGKGSKRKSSKRKKCVDPTCPSPNHHYIGENGNVDESLKAIESGAGQLEFYQFWLMVSAAMHVIVLIVLLILSMGDRKTHSDPADEPVVEETETDSQDFGSWLKNRN